MIMQRISIIFATLIVVTYSIPQGLYHNQYKYHSSSSQYKNDELQEKTENEGFYSQQGDLEGKQDPKTDGYTSHLRYTNPKNNGGELDDLTQQTENVDLKGFKTRQHGSHHGSHGHHGHNSGSHHLYPGSHGLNSDSQRFQSGSQGFQTGSQGYQTGSQGFQSGSHGLQSGSQGFQSGSHGLQSGSHGFQSGSQGLQSGSHHNDGSNDDSLHGTQGESRSYGSQSSYSYSGTYNSGSTTGNSNVGTSSDSQLHSLEQKLEGDLTRQLQNALSNYNYGKSSSSSSSSSYSTNVNNEADLQKLEDELKRNLTEQLQSQLQKQGGARGSYSYTITTTGGQYQPQQQKTYTSQDIQQLQKHLEDNLHNQLQQSYQGQNNGNTRKFYVVKTYGVTSGLSDIAKQLEENLARQLNDAARKQHLSSSSYSQSYSSTSAQMNADLEKLKEELKRNLTQQLQEQLDTTYGTQGTRGSYSYTISSGGKHNQNANYDNQELEDLKNQLQSNLLKQLENDVRTEYSQTSSYNSFNSQTSNQNTGTYGQQRPITRDGSNTDDTLSHHTVSYGRPTINTDSQRSTTRVSTAYGQGNTYQKPGTINNHYNNRPTSQIHSTNTEPDDVQVPIEPTTYTNSYKPKQQTDNIRRDDTQQQVVEPIPTFNRPTGSSQGGLVQTHYTVVQPIISLPTVIRRAEDDLKYDINSHYVQEQIRLYKEKYNLDEQDDVDFNVVLRQIKNDFRKKLNTKINDELKHTYGEQVQVGSYFHSKVRGNNEPQTYANYKIGDFDDLKKDVETKLFEQLTKAVRQEETTYVNHNTYNTQTNNGQLSKYNTFGEGSTNSQQGHVNVPSTHTSGSQNNRQYTYTYSTNTQGTDLDSQLNTIRSDLERQLQQQIQDYKSKNAQVSSNSQTQQYDQSYWKTVQDELRANFSTQLQNTLQQKYGKQGQVGGVTYKITSTNPGFNYNKKIEDFTKQLESDIFRQVTDGLSRYTFSQQSSHGYARPNVYSSTDLLNANRGYSTSTGYQHGNSYSSSSGMRQGSYASSSSMGHQHTTSEEDCMHDDPTVRTVHLPTSASAITHTQKLLKNEQNMNGQQEDSTEELFKKIDYDSSEEQKPQSIFESNIHQTQQMINLNQNINKQEKVHSQNNKFSNEEHSSEELHHATQQLTNQQQINQAQIDLSQQSLDLGQQTMDLGQQSLHSGQQTIDMGQQTMDMGQQTMDMGQQTMDLGQQIMDLGQQTEDDGQKLEMIDYSDLTQQTEDDFGQLQFSGHSSQQQIETGQHTVDDDSSDMEHLTQQQSNKYLTQQKQDLVQHEQSQESVQQADDITQHMEDLTQQTVDQFNQFHQKQESGELTQQVENGFDTLHSASNENKFHPQASVNQGTVQHQSSYQSSSSYSSSHSASFSNNHQQSDHSDLVVAGVDEITTPKPGFWKRLGHSIESSYHTAKDKAKSALNLR